MQGHVVYDNEVMKGMDYFRDFQDDVPKRCNPFDYFMELMSIETLIEKTESEPDTELNMEVIEKAYQELIAFLSAKYHSSELEKDVTFMHPDIQELPKP